MNKLLHDGLITEVEKLKRITTDLSIETIVNFIAIEQRRFSEKSLSGNYLHSPLKQGMYLLAIASNQPEPKEVKDFDKGKAEQLIRILNSIFNKYALAYFPEKMECIEGLNEQWHRDRRVAMPAFLNYFTSGFKISTDQIKSWIQFYYQGFEDKISAKLGIPYQTLIDVGDYFESKILQHFNDLKDVMDRVNEHIIEFEKLMEKDCDSAMSKIKDNEELKSLLEKLYSGASEVYSIDASEIEEKFGEQVKNSILLHFTTIRGTSEEIRYITDDNPVISKPIISVDGEKLYFVLNNSFYQAIICNVENELSRGKGANSFLKARDRRLEGKTVEQFKRLFPTDAEFYESVFETDKAHYEHDLVIVHNDCLLVVEAKASPPREPLRDPSKAFLRIRDHFKSNAGIQKAYNQAHSLESNLIKNGKVELFDRKGNKLADLESARFKKIYCICVTRDDFGALATDLSLLLDKDDSYDYPWAINITDLEFMFDGFLHLDMGYEDLYRYLDQRRMLHGKVFGTDELEYAGAFLNYGGLEAFIELDSDFIPLDISESDIFDQIYFAGIKGEKFTFSPIEPILTMPNKRALFNNKPTQPKDSKKKKTKRKTSKASRKKNRRK